MLLLFHKNNNKNVSFIFQRRKFNRRSQNNNKQKANEKSRQIIRRSRDFLNNFNRSGMKRRTLTNDSDDCIIIENSNQNIVICLDDDSMQAPEKKVFNDTLEDGEIRSQFETNVEETLEEGQIRSEVESLLDSILDEAIPNNLSTISIGDNTVVDPNTTPNNNNQNKPNSNMEVSFYEDFKAGFNSNHVVPLYDPISDDSFVTLGDRTLKPANISLDKTLTPNKSITPKNAKKRLNKSSADDSVIFCGEVIDLDLVPTKRAKTSEDFIQLPRCYPAPRRRLPQINPWAQFVNLPKPSPTKKQKQQQQQKQQQPQQQKQPSSSSAPPKPDVPKEKRMVVIDGSNVAFHHSNNKEFSVKGISIAVEYFKSRGHEVKVIVPQFRMKKYLSTDQNALETLQQQGIVILTPSKNLPGQCSSSYDDRFILDVADNFDAAIISNDNYKDLLDEKPCECFFFSFGFFL